tara:strand:- start:187 stop:954 length:768 start_codon:yes stop_codon:yes gene_type:complete
MLGLGNSLSTTVAPSGGFELTDVSGLEIWLKYNEGFEAGLNNGEVIAAWQDSSGNANHAVQTATEFMPTYLNGAAEFFNGDSANKLGFTEIESVTQSIFIVIEADTDEVMTMFSSSQNSSVFYKINQSGTIEFRIRKGTTRTEDSSDLTTIQLQPFINDSTPMFICFNQKAGLDLDVYIAGNGTTELHSHDDYGVQPSGGTNTALKIDQIGTQAATTRPFDGRILEFAVYNRTLSQDEVVAIRENITTRTGVNIG